MQNPLPPGTLGGFTAIGLAISKFKSEAKSKEEKVSKEAELAYKAAKELIIDLPISKRKKQKYFEVMEKIEGTKGIYKVVALGWLLEKNHKNKLASLEEEELKDIATKLLNLGIDISATSPLYESFQL